MKWVITRETLLSYPNFSEPFDIHMDASLHQLCTCISQNGKPIAFYSCKLNPAQTWYTTTERELLSIVKVLKEFRYIPHSQQICIHTDHENLLYKSSQGHEIKALHRGILCGPLIHKRRIKCCCQCSQQT